MKRHNGKNKHSSYSFMAKQIDLYMWLLLEKTQNTTKSTNIVLLFPLGVDQNTHEVQLTYATCSDSLKPVHLHNNAAKPCVNTTAT